MFVIVFSSRVFLYLQETPNISHSSYDIVCVGKSLYFYLYCSFISIFCLCWINTNICSRLFNKTSYMDRGEREKGFRLKTKMFFKCNSPIIWFSFLFLGLKKNGCVLDNASNDFKVDTDTIEVLIEIKSFYCRQRQ